jgi:hypothetical protein
MKWSAEIPALGGPYWKKEGINAPALIVHLNIYSIQFLKSQYKTPAERKTDMINYTMLHYPNSPERITMWRNKTLEDFTDYWCGPISAPEFVIDK